MDIRPCTDADLSVLCSRWRTPGGVHEAHHVCQRAGQTTYLVAWHDQEPLGSGVLQWGGCIGSNARTAYPEAVELNHLQVRDEYRGQGVGSALIAAAEDLIARTGCYQMAVGVAEDNPAAERLYRRLGYRRTGVLDVSEYDWITPEGTVRHETERDHLLIKALNYTSEQEG
ncbi:MULTISPECIES: GNAT family N-acetyltransferase [Micrococcaceae]|uniref:GNAT family N-acetyltransferase n=1 Tax=Micrococcaceae TaxID=1268 RepID=UPI001610E7C9|nr:MULTISPECIES: GNAT family N-acetyltransferase [Micrococcaceae]MBB5749011.1 GNAT superfamily N-acetyltransferase [Micrococcus sp. TA1]HRO31190.1 GNAT family N-acetyltransferase [Citricoccus sp.]HRO94543.1 GNAT family N-acetyltransferase [Citricoccus sp.]